MFTQILSQSVRVGAARPAMAVAATARVVRGRRAKLDPPGTSVVGARRGLRA